MDLLIFTPTGWFNAQATDLHNNSISEEIKWFKMQICENIRIIMSKYVFGLNLDFINPEYI